MIDADWFRRLQQSLEYGLGFELFLLVGPGGYAKRGLTRLADELGRFGRPRWHALDRGGLDELLGRPEPGVVHYVHGLENLPAAAVRGVVERMNVNRQRLRDLDAPVLMWISDDRYEDFVRHAPDLLAWRSQVEVISRAEFEGAPQRKSTEPLDASADEPRQQPALTRARRPQRWTVLDQRYELVERVGAGVFADAWKAFDTEESVIVTVKILAEWWADSQTVIDQFREGARIMSTLRHPGIMSILAPVAPCNRSWYYVVPYYGRGDLEQAVSCSERGRPRALEACADAIEGLNYAHARGFIHRAVHPRNIMIAEDGHGVLADFDLAWATAGAGRGTLDSFAYVAPEELGSTGAVDARADVYSAGMCVVFALFGEHPPPLLAATEPKLLSQLQCGEELRAAIAGAIAYRAEQRTTTGAQLVAAIRRELAESHSAGASARPWWTASDVDEFGRWATLRVGAVEQRMRWIEPGAFVMGSPESEPGRFEQEGPAHDVTLSRGFWLAETPCTQALWLELMGENPSRFQSPDRPVEHVSWDDVQRLLDELARRVLGPRFGLPTEAQWEYACRAGTTTARYADVDASAWCWSNSGGSTHPVGQKQPNAWGLHDMLGNVWEWCADGLRLYAAAAVSDPAGPPTADRVCRGGSWGDDARFARAACRVAYEPSYGFGSIGFRLALLDVE